MTDDARIGTTETAPTFPANPWVQLTDEAIIINAGYSDTLHRLLRWIPKVQWLPDRRHWLVPLSGIDLIRSVLPEISRLAEATHEAPAVATDTAGKDGDRSAEQDRPVVTPHAAPRQLFPPEASERDLFRNAARFLYGTDWQRDTARAMGRQEANLACWLAGQNVMEDDPAILLNEMLALMRKRSEAIMAAAERLAEAIEQRAPRTSSRGL